MYLAIMGSDSAVAAASVVACLIDECLVSLRRSSNWCLGGKREPEKKTGDLAAVVVVVVAVTAVEFVDGEIAKRAGSEATLELPHSLAAVVEAECAAARIRESY